MASKKSHIYIILIILSFVGLILGQFHWISTAFDLKQDEMVNKATDVLIDVINEAEDTYYCIDFYSNSYLDTNESLSLVKRSKGGINDTVPFKFWNPKIMGDSVYNYPSVHTNFRAIIESVLHVRYIFDDASDTLSNKGIKNKKPNISKFDILENEDFFNLLDTILSRELLKNNLPSEFAYLISTMDSDSLVFQKDISKHSMMDSPAIQGSFFTDNYFFKPYKIKLYFPDNLKHIYKSLLVATIGTSSFIILLILLIAFFIKTLLHQKVLTEMKSDFIQNMTHEFKTPISNINLAIETLEKKNQLKDDVILKILKEENHRLKHNIDLVLNTAFFKDNEIRLNKSSVNLNELLKQTISIFDKAIIGQDIQVKYELDEKLEPVLLDEIHFTNAIHNIIDNSIKYSKGNILIRVSTKRIMEKIVIEIEDNGIGISSKYEKFVFNRFFRVPTGNTHDVKGFGLGLSYIKNIVEAHSCTVKIESKIGHGTNVIISIPTNNE